MEYNLLDLDDGVPLWRPPAHSEEPQQPPIEPQQPPIEPPVFNPLFSSAEAARRVRLPVFWTGAPRQWFAAAEAQFRTYGVVDSVDKFNVAVAALPESVARHAAHILEEPPVYFPYEELRHHLTSHHELTNFEKVERITAGEPLGARKPSEMLAAMMEFCPRGEEKSVFMSYFFLQRLPTEIRILLAEDDHTDLRTLAARADKLMAHNNVGGGVMAAVKQGQQTRDNGQGRRGTRGRGQGGHKQAATTVMAPGAVAQTAVGLCWYHWKFGDKAQKCDPTCTWEGN